MPEENLTPITVLHNSTKTTTMTVTKRTWKVPTSSTKQGADNYNGGKMTQNTPSSGTWPLTVISDDISKVNDVDGPLLVAHPVPPQGHRHGLAAGLRQEPCVMNRLVGELVHVPAPAFIRGELQLLRVGVQQGDGHDQAAWVRDDVGVRPVQSLDKKNRGMGHQTAQHKSNLKRAVELGSHSL